jgi:hypothetical protein
MPARWEGGLGDAKALQGWLLEDVPDSTIILTSEQEMQMFIQCGWRGWWGWCEWCECCGWCG